MPDRREELGLNRNSLHAMACPKCGEMQDVQTEQDGYGNNHHRCRQCGTLLSSQAPDSFEEPGPSD
jgi:predicted RNA-binding Zn-ribbon protein involved in translation (DUF1610 family)